MSTSGLNINRNRASLFKCQEMFCHAGFPGADGQHDVSAGCGAVGCQVPEDFVTRPIAERLHRCLDIGRPRVIVRFSKPWHGTILVDREAKSKNGTLDDTLSIFDNSFYSLSWS